MLYQLSYSRVQQGVSSERMASSTPIPMVAQNQRGGPRPRAGRGDLFLDELDEDVVEFAALAVFEGRQLGFGHLELRLRDE